MSLRSHAWLTIARVLLGAHVVLERVDVVVESAGMHAWHASRRCYERASRVRREESPFERGCRRISLACFAGAALLLALVVYGWAVMR